MVSSLVQDACEEDKGERKDKGERDEACVVVSIVRCVLCRWHIHDAPAELHLWYRKYLRRTSTSCVSDISATPTHGPTCLTRDASPLSASLVYEIPEMHHLLVHLQYLW